MNHSGNLTTHKNNLITILLAEDNEADVKITLRAFEKAQIKNNMYVVNDGQEALDYILHQGAFADESQFPRPDIILLDINMPKVSGIEVLKKIKVNPQIHMIPVVMLTSSKNKGDIRNCFESGANSYIPKPVEFSDFEKVVENFNYYWQCVNQLPVYKEEE